jgi:hypothetical protein
LYKSDYTETEKNDIPGLRKKVSQLHLDANLLSLPVCTKYLNAGMFIFFRTTELPTRENHHLCTVATSSRLTKK